MPGMTIAGLARAGGVGVETIRFYQRRGLLPTPPRAGEFGSGGVRRYDENDIRRLKFIKSAQASGFTLEQISELIALDSTNDRARAHELAAERVKALDKKIAELVAARDALAVLAERCGSGRKGPCPILVAFDQLPVTEAGR